MIDDENFPAAIKSLESQLEGHPESADLYNLLGFSYRNLDQYDTALAHYQTALGIDPEHKGAHEYLGELYLKTNQLEKAEAQLKTLKGLCTFCRERKKLAKAIKAHKANN